MLLLLSYFWGFSKYVLIYASELYSIMFVVFICMKKSLDFQINFIIPLIWLKVSFCSLRTLTWRNWLHLWITHLIQLANFYCFWKESRITVSSWLLPFYLESLWKIIKQLQPMHFLTFVPLAFWTIPDFYLPLSEVMNLTGKHRSGMRFC